MTLFVEVKPYLYTIKNINYESKGDVNELITRIIKDGCQLIIHWIKGKKDV